MINRNYVAKAMYKYHRPATHGKSLKQTRSNERVTLRKEYKENSWH